MFHGSIVALVTPFTTTGELDEEALRHLIEWQIQEKTDGIMLMGSTGESPTISEEEEDRILKIGVETCKKRVPLIIGTGTYDTRKSVKKTEKAKKMGADGCLVVTPYYNKPSFEGCKAHYEAIARVGFPIILYYNPTRTGLHLTPKMIAEIAEIPQVVAIKDASGEVDQSIEIMRLSPKPLFSGDDTLTLPIMCSGGCGVISIVANLVPKQWKQMVASIASGERSVAKALFDRYFYLCKSLVMETNPIGVKFALSLLNKCSSTVRLPLVEPQEATKQKIRQEMFKLQLLEEAAFHLEMV